MRLIDADELMKTYARFVAPSNNSDFENEPTWNDAVSLLESAPTVDAVPVKHGHWIFNPKDAIEMMFTLPICSECGVKSCDGGNYCHNCGAKMDEKGKEDGI